MSSAVVCHVFWLKESSLSYSRGNILKSCPPKTLVFFFVLLCLYNVVIACVCACMCVLRYKCGSIYIPRASVEVRPWLSVLNFIVQTGSLAHHGARQASWSTNFQGFSSLHALSCCRNAGITDLCYHFLLYVGTGIRTQAHILTH